MITYLGTAYFATITKQNKIYTINHLHTSYIFLFTCTLRIVPSINNIYIENYMWKVSAIRLFLSKNPSLDTIFVSRLRIDDYKFDLNERIIWIKEIPYCDNDLDKEYTRCSMNKNESTFFEKNANYVLILTH